MKMLCYDTIHNRNNISNNNVSVDNSFKHFTPISDSGIYYYMCGTLKLVAWVD